VPGLQWTRVLPVPAVLVLVLGAAVVGGPLAALVGKTRATGAAVGERERESESERERER